MGTAETRRAIEAAHRAQPAWRALLAEAAPTDGPRSRSRERSGIGNLSVAVKPSVARQQRWP
jgi:hypothetical protein